MKARHQFDCAVDVAQTLARGHVGRRKDAATWRHPGHIHGGDMLNLVQTLGSINYRDVFIVRHCGLILEVSGHVFESSDGVEFYHDSITISGCKEDLSCLIPDKVIDEFERDISSRIAAKAKGD